MQDKLAGNLAEINGSKSTAIELQLLYCHGVGLGLKPLPSTKCPNAYALHCDLMQNLRFKNLGSFKARVDLQFRQ